MSLSSAAAAAPRRGSRLLVGAAILGAAALLALLGLMVARAQRELQASAPAPDFAFTDFQGRAWTPDALRGQVVVLNFWASWCVECVAEAAELEGLWRDYEGRGVVVLGLAYTDTEPEARAYVERHGLTFPNGMDRAARISARYGLTGVPETVVLDRRGRVAAIPTAGGGTVTKVVGAIGPGAPVRAEDMRGLLDSLVAAAP